jgi:hypothetical protein
LASFKTVFRTVWDGAAFVTEAVITKVADVAEVGLTVVDAAIDGVLSVPGRILGAMGRPAAAGQHAAAAEQQSEHQVKAAAADATKEVEAARVGNQLQRMARLRLKGHDHAVAEVGSTVPGYFVSYIKSLTTRELDALGKADGAVVQEWMLGKRGPPDGIRSVDAVQMRSTMSAQVPNAAPVPGARTTQEQAVMARLAERIRGLRHPRADDDIESGYAATI